MALPLKVKQQFLKEPERLLQITFPKHGFGFKPSALLNPLSSGTESDLMTSLNQRSGILMKEIDESRIKEFLEECRKLPLATYLEAPFIKKVSLINFNEMNFEEYCAAVMQVFNDLRGMKLTFEQGLRIEDLLLKLLTPEMSRKISKLIIADLNWHNYNYNNCYLMVARSVTTGQFEWYVSDRFGSSFKRMKHNLSGEWSIIQPIQRRENGHLTYKSLTPNSQTSSKNRKSTLT